MEGVVVSEEMRSLSNNEYLERLQLVIHQLHGAASIHVESIHVLETFKGQTVWEGVVEVFELRNHPRATRAYAWSHGTGHEEKLTAVLEVPPVKDVLTAVQVNHCRTKERWAWVRSLSRQIITVPRTDPVNLADTASP